MAKEWVNAYAEIDQFDGGELMGMHQGSSVFRDGIEYCIREGVLLKLVDVVPNAPRSGLPMSSTGYVPAYMYNPQTDDYMTPRQFFLGQFGLDMWNDLIPRGGPVEAPHGPYTPPPGSWESIRAASFENQGMPFRNVFPESRNPDETKKPRSAYEDQGWVNPYPETEGRAAHKPIAGFQLPAQPSPLVQAAIRTPIRTVKAPRYGPHPEEAAIMLMNIIGNRGLASTFNPMAGSSTPSDNIYGPSK